MTVNARRIFVDATNLQHTTNTSLQYVLDDLDSACPAHVEAYVQAAINLTGAALVVATLPNLVIGGTETVVLAFTTVVEDVGGAGDALVITITRTQAAPVVLRTYAVDIVANEHRTISLSISDAPPVFAAATVYTVEINGILNNTAAERDIRAIVMDA